MGVHRKHLTRVTVPKMSLYKFVAMLGEYRELVSKRKGNKYGIEDLARRHGVMSKTIRGWAQKYSRDMMLFGASQPLMLRKIARNEETIYGLELKLKRLKAAKGKKVNESVIYLKDMNQKLTEENKMFRDLYNDMRRRLDASVRANKVNRNMLSKSRLELNVFRKASGQKPVHTRRTLPDISDVVPGNPR